MEASAPQSSEIRRGGEGPAFHRGDGCIRGDHCGGGAGGSQSARSCNWLGGRLKPENPVRAGEPGAGRGPDVTPPPPAAPGRRSGEKRERSAAVAGSNSSTRQLVAWTCPEKLGFSSALSPDLVRALSFHLFLVLKLSPGRKPLEMRPPESRQHSRIALRLGIC